MTDESTIRDLEQKRRDAMVAADTNTLGRLFDDELAWIHATARVDTKAGLLHAIASGSTKYRSIRVEDETVRLIGNVALVSGLAFMSAEIKGEQRELANRFTIVWGPLHSDPKVVNWQSTSLPK
jgi:ketosteroid isomerase-like protein